MIDVFDNELPFIYEFRPGVKASYVLGHDVISQWLSNPPAGVLPAQFLLYDGHGSTRGLVDAMGLPVSVGSEQQVFAYDAYGNQLVGSGLTTAAAALTTLLYSGEFSDLATGLQYLRARFYNPATGRFNRVDPFSGNINDPQSLHKYLYTHGDPVNGIDPSGEFVGIAVLVGLGSLFSLGTGAAFERLGGTFIEGLVVGAQISVAFTVAGVSKGLGGILDTSFSALLQGSAALLAKIVANNVLGRPNDPAALGITALKGFAAGAISSAILYRVPNKAALAGVSSVLSDAGGFFAGQLSLKEVVKNALIQAAISLIINGAVEADFAADSSIAAKVLSSNAVQKELDAISKIYGAVLGTVLTSVRDIARTCG